MACLFHPANELGAFESGLAAKYMRHHYGNRLWGLYDHGCSGAELGKNPRFIWRRHYQSA